MKKKVIGNIIIKDNSIYKNKIDLINKSLKNSTNEEKAFLIRDLEKYSNNYENGNIIIKQFVNSNIDMTIFHDLNILYDGHRCHIGFLIFTNRNIYIINYNDIYGKMSIDSNNNLYKLYYSNKVSLFNPINVLKRHISIINSILDNEYKDFIYGFVIVNKNTKLSGKINDSRIIKVNQLLKVISKIEKKSKISLKLNINNLVEKINTYSIDEEVVENISFTENVSNDKIFDLNEILKNKLINYRNYKSKQINNFPSYILSNSLIKEIIKIKPSTKAELISINGFSAVKYNKYGKDILRIINGK